MTVKTNAYQVGLSDTATNNFTLTADAADGTVKLARGNHGATTDDIMTVSAGGVVKHPHNAVAFSAYLTASQSISSATWTKVQFNAEAFDTANAFDAVTNYRFRPVVAGYYQFNAGVTVTSGANQLLIALYKNGTDVRDGARTDTTALCYRTNVSGLIYLNGSTDYVEVWTYLSPARSLDITGGSAYFDGFLVMAA